MKKILSVLLCLVLSLLLVGCCIPTASESSLPELTLYTELPAFCDDFDAVSKWMSEDSLSTIDDFMSKSIAAYNTYDAAEFCLYMYDQNFLENLELLRDDATYVATLLKSSDAITSLAATTIAYYLSNADLSYAQWNTAYAGLVAYPEDSDTSYEDLQSNMAFVINRYAFVFYGENVIDIE